MLTALAPMNTSLLSQSSNAETTTPLTRSTQSTITHNQPFQLSERIYTQQYAGIYFTRLNILRQRVLQNAHGIWSKRGIFVNKVLDVLPGSLSYIIGTIYVNMPLKPCILDSVTRESWILPPPSREKYVSENDTIYLEDESGRVKLFGKGLSGTSLVTGVVAGFLGYETSQGDFEVVEVCFANFEPQKPLPMETDTSSWIGFVSGLCLGKEGGMDFSLQLLVDFLTGELGTFEVRFLNLLTRAHRIPNLLPKFLNW